MQVLLLVALLVGLWPCVALAQLPPTLTWNYEHKKPQAFIVSRSLDGKAWEDIAQLPGERGAVRWHDTTLPVLKDRTLVYYQVRAVRGQAVSPPSAPVSITLGPPPPGECLTEQPDPKMTITVCTLQ
jgi:hypothetical protein